MGKYSLDVFFRPSNVALIGATDAEASVGRALFTNLLNAPFRGRIFPVNPRRSEVLGVKAFPSIKAIPGTVDLAVIATPAATVPEVVRECGEAGVAGAVIISAGFREVGAEGAALERAVREEATKSGIRVVGPNCLGVMSPFSGLNATFAANYASPGNVAFVSQSGSLCTSVLDWSQRNGLGFSAFVSAGSMIDVGWGDLIDYLGSDPHTRSILLYIESIDDARRFVSAARAVAQTKPVIVVKAGRSEATARAAASHTGAMASSDKVIDAVFRRCGVLRVNRIADLFYIANTLSKQPRPTGKRLAILTNAGGPAVLAADALIESGGELAPLTEATLNGLNEFLPPHWSHGNPVDVLGDASPERLERALDLVVRDPNADGAIVVVTPQGMTSCTRLAEALARLKLPANKPVLASFMGGAGVAGAVDVLERRGIPNFPFADTAARAFASMWRYTDNLRALYETPSQVERLPENKDEARRIVQNVRATGRLLLTEFESKRILELYGVPPVPTRFAGSIDEAEAAAAELGFPVVLKLQSETITHKSEVGGVRLGLRCQEDVRETYRSLAAIPGFGGVTVQSMANRSQGYEVILGSMTDPQFGPVLMFGTGGEFVEVYQDTAMGLPPLNTTLARRLMERTRVHKALQGIRGRQPVDFEALEEALVHFSTLVLDIPEIREIEINPLLVSADGVVALDARILLFAAGESIPRSAIRPYPSQYTWQAELRDGSTAVIRPIRPEDEPSIARFHTTLSDRTVYSRYFGFLKLSDRIAHERLTRVCFVDYDREIALVAEQDGTILGVVRLVREQNGETAEFAIVISDSLQRSGLGTQLMRRILDVARAEKIRVVDGLVLPENRGMLRVCEKLGFSSEYRPRDEAMYVKFSAGE
jgi:acetyltransferase